MGGDATDSPSADILRTRLLPPRLPPTSLLRTALVERVVAGLTGRLVLVVAAAGYGKSTLLAQALAHRLGSDEPPELEPLPDELEGQAHEVSAARARSRGGRFDD